MTTEKSPSRRVSEHLRTLPISRNLQFVVLVFVCVFFAVLGLVYFSSSLTSAARAYVQGVNSFSFTGSGDLTVGSVAGRQPLPAGCAGTGARRGRRRYGSARQRRWQTTRRTRLQGE